MGIRRITLAAIVAAVLLVPAIAAAANLLTDEQTPASSGALQNPSLAVDPVTQTRVALAFANVPNATVARASSWPTASGPWPFTVVDPQSGLDGPVIAWGALNDVYAAAAHEIGGACTASSGLTLSVSNNAGMTFGAPVPVAANSSTEIARGAAIAYDAASTDVYVAYAKPSWATAPGCGSQAQPATSPVFVRVFTSAGVPKGLIPIGGAASRMSSPAITVTALGEFAVAVHDTSDGKNDITTFACRVSSGCGPPVVVADGTAAAGTPPAIAQSGGRIVVAWQAGDGAGARVRSATSVNGGASYGQSVPIEPGSATSSAPQLAATANGRVDAVYLSGDNLRSVSSLAGGSSEQWSTPVTIPGSIVADPYSRLALATSVTDAGPAKTLLAWKTFAGDLRLRAIVHGSIAPVVTPGQAFTVAKGSSTTLHIDARDDDGDPLTYAVSTQPTSAGASAAFPDTARSAMTFKAGHVTRTELVAVKVTDLAGTAATDTVAVTVKNASPEVTCTTLFVAAGKDLPIDPAGCAEDPDGDDLTFALTDAAGGKLTLADSGYTFTPLAGAKSSFLLKVSDDDATVQARVNVAVLSTDSKVAIKVTGGEGQRNVYAGATLRLRATGTDATGSSLPVSWDFGDGTSRSRGRSVTHAYALPGLWYVTASTTSTAARFRVRVYPRPFGLIGAIRFIGRSTVLVSLHCRAAGTVTARVLGARSHVRRVMRGGALTRSLHVPTGALANKGTITVMVSFAPANAGPLPVPQLRRVVVVPASLRR